MINLKTITQGIERLLREKLSGYNIERNPMRPDDPWKAAVNKAWVGVYRGVTEYASHSIGSLPWKATIDVIIEIQVADLTSAEDCEDKLLDAEKEVLDCINSDRTLGGTVDMVLGYSVAYETNRTQSAYYQAAIITIKSESRTS